MINYRFLPRLTAIFLASSQMVFASTTSSASLDEFKPESKTIKKFSDYTVETIRYGTIPSTQSVAKTHLNDLESKTINVITAKKQTGGIGMWGREWKSPEGNVFATFCFHLPVDFSTPQDFKNKVEALPMMAGLVMKDTLASLGVDKNDLFLRWTNNLVVRQKNDDEQFVDHKIAGCLINPEPDFTSQSLHVRLGIGLNVSLSDETIQAIDQPVLSLAQLLSTETMPSVNVVITELTKSLITGLSLLETGSEYPLAQYQSALAYINEEVNIREKIIDFDSLKYFSEYGNGDVDYSPYDLSNFHIENLTSQTDIEKITSFAIISGVFKGVASDGNALLEIKLKSGETTTIKLCTGEIVPRSEISKAERLDLESFQRWIEKNDVA